MGIQIRTITEGEFEAWSRAEARGFGGHATDKYVSIMRSIAELDRSFGAFDGDQIVGSTTTRTSGMTVPGGCADLGYVDDVSVLPTHRRQGVMTNLMRAQLDQIHERGEPLAALTASESAIYERFGFGIATWIDSWTIQRVHTGLSVAPHGGGRLDFISADTAQSEWPRLHRRVAGNRVGMVHYSPAYWKVELSDGEFQRRGASEYFHVAYRRDGEVVGLVTYRIDDSTVLVIFLLGEDSEVEAELWRYCFGIDLMTDIRAFNQPTDHPLPWRLSDPRRLVRSTSDHIWLRLVDVPRALEARGYFTPGDLVLRVVDNFCRWNDDDFRLEASTTGASCQPTGRSPDLRLTAAELAAAYLGGNSFSRLARAGRISELTPGAVEAADRMFRTDREPWSLEL